jgi:hypothetical protein
MRAAPVGSLSDHRAENRTTKCPESLCRMPVLPPSGRRGSSPARTLLPGPRSYRLMRRSHSLSSPSASASFEESLQVATSPATGGTTPTLSLRILPWVPGPLSRRPRGVHLPVSSSTSSAFPRTLSRSASRLSPSKRFHDGSLFRDCSHFFMFRPPSLLASQIVPTAATYRRRAAEAFTSEQNMLSLPTHASDLLTTRPGNWWCGDLHPTRFAVLSAAPA